MEPSSRNLGFSVNTSSFVAPSLRRLKGATTVKDLQGVAVSAWIVQYRRLMETIPMGQLASVDAVTNRLCVAPSTIKHPRAVNVPFAIQKLKKGTNVRWDFVYHVYKSISERSQPNKTYSISSALGVTAAEYQK